MESARDWELLILRTRTAQGLTVKKQKQKQNLNHHLLHSYSLGRTTLRLRI